MGYTENNLWNNEYTYNYGTFKSALWPSYSHSSHLLFWPETGAATLDLNFKWTHDDQTNFTASDSRGTGYYDILLEFKNNQISVLITVES